MKNWYHFLPISLVLHTGFFALAWFCIPDTPAYQIFALECDHIERIVTFEEIEVFDDSSSQSIHEEPVSEDEDPFEQAEIEVEQPEIHLGMPAIPDVLTEPLQETAPIVPEIELPSETIPEITTDSVEPKTSELAIINSDAQVLQGNADISATVSGSENAVSANGSQPANAGVQNAVHSSDVSHQTDEMELWKAYTQTLSKHFRLQKHYPEMAKKLRLEGTVWLLVEINRSGEILSAEIAQSSGIEILDEAALNSAEKAGPVPGFPKETSAETKKLRIPYHYRLK